MEKLINLLNEYEAIRHKTSIVADIWWWEKDRLSYLGLNTHYSELLCISKGYEFIEWLVKNNNIDRDKIIEKSDFMPIVSNKVWDFLQPTEEQELLMLLAISDNPISDLISYLK